MGASALLYLGAKTPVPACLVAIDPGVRTCACAVFERGVLRKIGYDLRDCIADAAIVEKPQADARVGQYNVDLAIAGALLAGRVCPNGYVRFAEPREWKGAAAKPIHHARVWAALEGAEHAVFPSGTAARILEARDKGARDGWRKSGGQYYGRAKGADVHNLLDAAGIGLWYLGRL